MTNNECKVAIVGAGNMAREHARVFNNIPNVRLVGIYSRTRSKAELLANEFGINEVYNSISELFEKTQPDLVVLAVIETAMKSVTLECLDYPCTILMEKPPGLTFVESTEIEGAVKKAGRKVLVGLNRRFLSSTRTAYVDLAQNKSPRFIHVQDQQSLIDAKSLGHSDPVVKNWMYANSIHLIDYLRYFGRGEITSINPIIPWKPETSQIVMAQILFSSGDIGIYEGIWQGPGPWAVSISTPEMRWELRPLEKAVYQNLGERNLHSVDVHSWDLKFKPGFRLQADMAVAAALNKQSESPTIHDAMDTMRLIHGIFEQ